VPGGRSSRASASSNSGPATSSEGGETAGPSIRTAGDDDVARVEQLWQAALDDLSERRGGSLLVEDSSAASAAAARCASRDAYVVLGSYAGVECGLGIAHFIGSGDAQRCAIEVLYVEPEFRRLGIGEALLSALEEFGHRWGCVGIEVPVLPRAQEAKTFFEVAGYRARLLVMHRPYRE
jgi:GNAT superfamily N-acetyltransferase